METGIWLAKVFGPFLAIVGLWMLLYGDNFVKIMTSIKNSASGLYFSALINMLLGLVIINMFNMWWMDMTFFVTLLGWVLFIRGLCGLFAPHFLHKMFMHNHNFMKVVGIIPFIWGLLLIWAGFYIG